MWLVAWVLVWSTASPVQADVPVVCALLFYSPTCPHCHQVITEDLQPLLEKYGDQLRIVGVDTSSPGGQVLFQPAIERFNIPPERQAVPMLIIDGMISLARSKFRRSFRDWWMHT
jgi:thiol-disulfide isomerase/thioredoxin